MAGGAVWGGVGVYGGGGTVAWFIAVEERRWFMP